MREAEERTKGERIKRYEDAPVLQVEIIQVLNDGCLASVKRQSQKDFYRTTGR